MKRTYMRETYTLGSLLVYKSSPRKGGTLPAFACDTLEPHAIPWVDDPFIGQVAGKHIRGRTAIPEGRYRIGLCESKSYKRMMPQLLNVPNFPTILLRTGKLPSQTRGDILVGESACLGVGHRADMPCLLNSRKNFNQLFALIEEAIDLGDEVWISVRSFNEWTYPLPSYGKDS